MSDLISRQAVLEEIRKIECEPGYQHVGEDWSVGLCIAESIVEEAESVEPERKKGKWQRRKGSDCWECSQCHAVLENDDLGMHNFYFCYHCGANMMNKSGYMDIEEVHYE